LTAKAPHHDRKDLGEAPPRAAESSSGANRLPSEAAGDDATRRIETTDRSRPGMPEGGAAHGRALGHPSSNGHASNGHASNGNGAHGNGRASANGHPSTNGHASAHASNGHATNGHASDGRAAAGRNGHVAVRPPAGGPVSDARPDDPVQAEARLVARLKAGESEAFEELVRVHGPRMLALARRYLPRETDAEDTLQDAFMSVFRSIGTFAGESRLTTWLHRVTVNAALMRIRARSRRPETLLGDVKVEVMAEPRGEVAWSSTATEVLSREETRSAVRKSLDRLQEESRIVVRLRDIEGMDLREISRLLGIGVNTVKSRLSRGRLALRSILENHLGTGTVQR
jgi:RNA polymerase sigma-70 factor, ECF subfamily